MNSSNEPSVRVPLAATTKPVSATAKLTKFYGKVRDVESLYLQVRRGEIFAFPVPNGAGKTSIFGHDCPRDSRLSSRCIGYLPGDVARYDSLSGREYLSVMSSLHSHRIASRATETVY